MFKHSAQEVLHTVQHAQIAPLRPTNSRDVTPERRLSVRLQRSKRPQRDVQRPTPDARREMFFERWPPLC